MTRPQGTISDAERAIEAYPLLNPTVVKEFETSKRNDNFLIVDEAGGRFVLRRYQRNPDPARIRFQLDFERALLKLGFPTPRVFKTRDGSSIHGDATGTWALFGFVEGEAYDYSAGQRVEELARRLAEFHRVSAAIDLAEVGTESDWMIESWWRSASTEMDRLEAMLSDTPVEAELTALRVWVEATRKSWTADVIEALPVGWCHGDLNALNFLLQGDRLAALLDWDVLHRGQLVEDVVLGGYYVGRMRSGSSDLRPEVFTRFVLEYHRHRPLNAAELAVMPQLLPVIWIPASSYYGILKRDGEDIAKLFPAHFNRFEKAVAQVSIVEDAVRAIKAGGQ